MKRRLANGPTRLEGVLTLARSHSPAYPASS
jgi:hypothetical protein